MAERAESATYCRWWSMRRSRSIGSEAGNHRRVETGLRSNDRPPFALAPDPRLDLAFNANYTHREEAYRSLMMDLTGRSARGERGVCWRCEAPAVAFGAIRVEPLGDIYLAFCESCGAWTLI
jgi:hypothetical protein